MASIQARQRVTNVAKSYRYRIFQAWGVHASDVAPQLADEDSESSPSSISMLRRLTRLCELEGDLGIVQTVLSAQCHKRAEAYGLNKRGSDPHHVTTGDVDATIAVFRNRATSSSAKARLQTNESSRLFPSREDSDLYTSEFYNGRNRFQHRDLVLGLSKKRFRPDIPTEAAEEATKKRRITRNVDRSGKQSCLF